MAIPRSAFRRSAHVSDSHRLHFRPAEDDLETTFKLWLWLELKLTLYTNSPFVINFAKSSRNTITYSLVGHLMLLRMTMALATSMPFAAIMPYVTQVRCVGCPFPEHPTRTDGTAAVFRLVHLQESLYSGHIPSHGSQAG